MKSLAKNPLFYLSLALAVALGFQIYSIAGAAWKEPSSGPPGPSGQPAQPLDTSAFAQKKQGDLVISGAGAISSGLTTEGTQFLGANWNTTGNIYFAGSGKNAAIRFDVTGGKLMFRNFGEGWKEFGTGGGDAFWKELVPGSIYYDGDKVSILNPAGAASRAYFYVPRYNGAPPQYTHNEAGRSLNFGLHNIDIVFDGKTDKPRIGCDSDLQKLFDCAYYHSKAAPAYDWITDFLGSAGDPSQKFNIAYSTNPPTGYSPMHFSLVLDKVPDEGYGYVLMGRYQERMEGYPATSRWLPLAGSSGELTRGKKKEDFSPRIFCDISTNENIGDCGNEAVKAPGPGKAGGWPDVVYNWMTTSDRPDENYTGNVVELWQRKVVRAVSGGGTIPQISFLKQGATVEASVARVNTVNLVSDWAVPPSLSKPGGMNWFVPGISTGCTQDSDRGKLMFVQGTNYGDRLCYCRKGGSSAEEGSYVNRYLWSCW